MFSIFDIDSDLEFLRDVTKTVDDHLGRLFETAEDAAEEWQREDARDRVEYVVGIGFVVCQTYMTAKMGERRLDKKQALSLGPSELPPFGRARGFDYEAAWCLCS